MPRFLRSSEPLLDSMSRHEMKRAVNDSQRSLWIYHLIWLQRPKREKEVAFQIFLAAGALLHDGAGNNLAKCLHESVWLRCHSRYDVELEERLPDPEIKHFSRGVNDTSHRDCKDISTRNCRPG